MKNFAVIGLKRDEFRGNFQPTTLSDEVEALNKQEAGQKFEKANPEYKAQDIQELPPKREKKTKEPIQAENEKE